MSFIFFCRVGGTKHSNGLEEQSTGYEVLGRIAEPISFGDCIGPTSINLASVGCMDVPAGGRAVQIVD